MAWLEKAYTQHSNGLTGLKVDPVYDPLRAILAFKISFAASDSTNK